MFNDLFTPLRGLRGGSGVQRGLRGCDGPGHSAGGIQRWSFLKKCRQMFKNKRKCLKIKRKKVTAPGIQDKGASGKNNRREIEMKIKIGRKN